MRLYDYPGGFALQISPSLSRAARVWCAGGMAWLCAALLLLGLASFKTGFAPDFLTSSLWTSTGVLLRAGKALLVYGWGCSFLFGLGLLLTGEKSRASFDWCRAAGWGWHLVILIGVLSLCAGAGSGWENMPYPVWLWPGLIFCALPVCRAMLGEALSVEGPRPLSIVLAVWSALWALVLMTGGYVFVFWAGVPPFFASAGALAVFWGLVLVALCGFACAWGWRGQPGRCARWAVFCYGGVCLLGLAGFVPLLGSVYPWIPLNEGGIRILLTVALAGLVALSFFRNRDRRGREMGVWFLVAFMWISRVLLWHYFPDSGTGVSGREELILILLMAGLVGSCCFYGLLLFVPRCTGRDWPCVKAVARLLPVLSLLCVVWFGLAPFLGTGRGMTAPLLANEAVIQARYMTVFYMCLLAGYAFLSFWVAVVWLGGGRLAWVQAPLRFWGMDSTETEQGGGEQ